MSNAVARIESKDIRVGMRISVFQYQNVDDCTHVDTGEVVLLGPYSVVIRSDYNRGPVWYSTQFTQFYPA